MAPHTLTEEQQRLINRELSWLDSSEHLLDLAEDAEQPLLERVKFCGIFSMILDEFFMVRVAGLIEQAESGLGVRSADGLTPQQALGRIRRRVLALIARQSKLWKRELRPALAEEGVVVLGTVEDCSKKELRELTKRFEREIYPVLTPLGVGPGQPFPYISGLSLSLGVLAVDPETGEERFARVKVPEGFPRFVDVGSRLIPLEFVIAHFLPMLFPGMEISERAVFRVTRDADFELSDDADDLLEAIESELRRRRFGDVVRLEVSGSASTSMLGRLASGLQVETDQVYEIEGLLDLADLVQIAALDRPELKDEPWVAVVPPRFARAKEETIFDEIRRSDVLVHQPYESFRMSFEAFAQAAATDPNVIAIKTTVYRTSDDSSLVSALIDCAEQGKQSVCLVELKARFDERRNIEWSRAMEKAGVHVVHGFSDLKIHAKMTLIVRREEDVLRRYAHIGTGNYNATTARLYEDLGVFTADEEITADVADLFNYLTGFGAPQRFRRLLVAPFTMRARLIEEIRRVTAAAADGEPCRIRLKMNQLVDPTIIDELYAASEAGVPIDICARAICMLRAGVPGLSETVAARSIFGRFLEHSRIYSFETPESSTMYIGSADLMPRNLDRRIEVVIPIDNARVRQELNAVLDSVFADTTSAWELLPNDTRRRVRPQQGVKPHNHQANIRRRALARARRAADGANRGREV
jgi:polyphosphate kinase